MNNILLVLSCNCRNRKAPKDSLQKMKITFQLTCYKQVTRTGHGGRVSSQQCSNTVGQVRIQLRVDGRINLLTKKAINAL